MTSEKQLGPDILPANFNKETSTKDMIITTWSREAFGRIKSNFQEYLPLSLMTKKVCFVYKYLL